MDYKDPERVACLKKDWAELCPTDQAALLLEWGEQTVEDYKTDWRAALLKLGKWLLLALAGAVAASAALLLNSCAVTPAQHAQLQAVDTLLHAAAPYVITVKPLKK